MCNGDGTSCLGCESVDIQDVQFLLDGQGIRQLALVRRARAQVLRSDSSQRTRTKANKLLVDAQGAYNALWSNVWVGYQRVITNCSNTTFCTTVSTSASGQSVQSESQRLVDTLNRMVRLLRKATANSKSGAKLVSSMKALHQANLSELARIPATQSSCE